jgi:hypothetical protein
MPEIPDSANFFSSLDTHLTRQQVARLYGALGWRVRKCSWVDFEITNDWAELIIESESPILMHGPVADLLVRVEEVVAPLRAAGVSFHAECYGPEPDHELIVEIESSKTDGGSA